MGYEDAPATKMLATRCAVCGRPLLDSVSVEKGMGPDCRKRYGKSNGATLEEQTEANKIVYHIALRQTGDDVIYNLAVLRELGFEVLANRIAKRCRTVCISVEGDMLVVHTPYNPEAVSEFRNIQGRWWNSKRKVNMVPVGAKSQLWALLQRCFPGETGLGPKGAFGIPGENK